MEVRRLGFTGGEEEEANGNGGRGEPRGRGMGRRRRRRERRWGLVAASRRVRGKRKEIKGRLVVGKGKRGRREGMSREEIYRRNRMGIVRKRRENEMRK